MYKGHFFSIPTHDCGCTLSKNSSQNKLTPPALQFSVLTWKCRTRHTDDNCVENIKQTGKIKISPLLQAVIQFWLHSAELCGPDWQHIGPKSCFSSIVLLLKPSHSSKEFKNQGLSSRFGKLQPTETCPAFEFLQDLQRLQEFPNLRKKLLKLKRQRMTHRAEVHRV